MQNDTPTKNAVKRLISFLFVCGIVVSAFGIYYIYVGVPKTTARNLYNAAHYQIEKNNRGEAIELLEQAYSTWPEEYIYLELEQLTATLVE